MSEVISLINLKGGVGKTVSSINIAYSFAEFNKKVLIVDDVISTGESLTAVRNLVNAAGAIEAASCAFLAEGDAADRDDIIFLEKLPLFFK